MYFMYLIMALHGSECKLILSVYCHMHIGCILLYQGAILDNEKAPKAKGFEGNSGKENETERMSR